MPAIEFIRGTEAIEEAMRASLYESVLDILGTTGTILPIGDAKHGLLTASTFKTVGEEQVTYTWSEPPNDFDTRPGYKALVPVIDFNGSDEEADTPDAAYWSRGNGSADSSFSVGAWVNPSSAGSGTRAILTKRTNTTGSTQREWEFDIDGSHKPRLVLLDESSGANIGRSAPALTLDTFAFVTCTYDETEASSGINVFVDGADVDDANVESGAYTAMEDTTAKVRLGFRAGVGADDIFWQGKMAGGPLGPFFTQQQLSADEVLRLYEIGRRALGL